MIDFNNPLKWIILQYRPGTGGKFFAACLMTIDRIAHWDRRVTNGTMSYTQWVDTQWQQPELFKWIAYEPLHDWNTRFFSRTFPRGNNIELDIYNQQMNVSASEYLKSLWQTDKLILDFINKTTVPLWWSNSNILKLDAVNDCPIHKQMLLSKIYPYNVSTGTGMYMMDCPLDENKYQNARHYGNKFEFGPFEDINSWYKFIWNNDFRLNFEINKPDLLLTDLLDFDKLESKIQIISKNLNSRYNVDDLFYVYTTWTDKHKTIINTHYR